ncbi:hypothetical protein DF3PA_100061 [Candidatus Defluviicoccus seviourii]|uniref:Uncharacterized protein n=1 Tax=Candidatus Defluviicoccus seviourii TaxID=2565273 RepID=A0A564W9R4_9PROT|nr:hypothetical protein DF3PA_100061 [Candidatus Defluviicoccus seviourii]
MATLIANGTGQPHDGARGASTDPIGRAQRWTVGVVLAFLAVFLVVMGSQFIMASLAGFAGAPVLAKLRQAIPVSAHEAKDLLSAKQDEMKWLESGEAAIDSGLARLLIAESLPADAKERDRLVAAAASDLKQGLAAAPLSGRGWARLAYSLAALEGWSPAAMTALRFSIAAAPFEPSLTLFRLRMGLEAWPHLDARDRASVLQQIRYAAKVDLKALALLAEERQSIPVVRAALRDQPHVLAELDRLRTQTGRDPQRRSGG